MSEEREPIRLRDDPGEDASLRAALEAVRGERADDAMLDRVLAGVLAGGGGGGGGGPTDPSGAAAFGKAVAATVSIVIAAATVVAIGGRYLARQDGRARPAIALDAGSALVADTGPSDAGPSDVGPTDVGPSDAGAPDAGGPSMTRARVPSPVAPELESEGALMMRATREHDPALSLALALDHRARFPTSAFAEDREALIVADLAALHRTREASAALDAFRSRWPRSPALPRLEADLARASPP